MTLTSSQRVELLSRIESIQQDTNSVTVEIGHVDDSNQVRHDSLFVRDAPATVCNTLRDEGWSLAVREGGVQVYDHR